MRCPDWDPDCGGRAFERMLEVGRRPHFSALHLAHDLACVLASSEWAARRSLWSSMARWFPDRIEARSPARPELGDGWVLDRFGRPMPGAAYPLPFAREVLGIDGDGPLSLVTGRRHPARSRRGCIAYANRLFALDVHLQMEHEAAIARCEATTRTLGLDPYDETHRR